MLLSSAMTSLAFFSWGNLNKITKITEISWRFRGAEMIKKDVPCKDPFTTYLTELELNFTRSYT